MRLMRRLATRQDLRSTFLSTAILPVKAFAVTLSLSSPKSIIRSQNTFRNVHYDSTLGDPDDCRPMKISRVGRKQASQMPRVVLNVGQDALQPRQSLPVPLLWVRSRIRSNTGEVMLCGFIKPPSARFWPALLACLSQEHRRPIFFSISFSSFS